MIVSKQVILGSGVVFATGIILWKFNQSKKGNVNFLRHKVQQILCHGRKDVKVIVVETLQDWMEISPTFMNEVTKLQLVGFDVEWYNNGKISLMQLALPNGYCILMRLNRLKVIPSELKSLLVDSDILKIGVGIKEDCLKLSSDFHCSCANWVDIRHMVRSRRLNCRKLGMAGIAQEVLNLTLDKDWRIRASDWEEGINKNGQLSQRQIEYASNDALVTLSVALSLAIDDIEKQRWYWRTELSAESFEDLLLITKKLCQIYAEVDFKYKCQKTSKSEESDKKNRCKSIPRKIDPAKKRHRNAIRKAPLYHNVKLEAPDGQQLCVTDVKKAKWYVTKGLGEYVDENETCVRLKFEPAGRPEGPAGDYYLTDKCNRCVVCGKMESYLRKYIVPHEYRKFFPEVMRDHQSHDVLLMCVHCHQKSNLHDLEIRLQLSKRCSAPLGTEEDVKVHFDADLKAVRSAAKALLKNKGQIPDERVIELKCILSEYYGVQEVDEALCKRGMNLESNVLNEGYIPHGKKVVDFFISNGDGILSLEEIWRQHFLDSMQPKFLPPFWSVSHQQQRLETRAAEKRIDPEDYKVAVGSKNMTK